MIHLIEFQNVDYASYSFSVAKRKSSRDLLNNNMKTLNITELYS